MAQVVAIASSPSSWHSLSGCDSTPPENLLPPTHASSSPPIAPHSALFSPAPDLLPLILESLASSSLSLLQIAHAHNTTLDALTTWMTRPDIAERLDELHLIAAQRARLVAAQHLAAATEALALIVHTGMSRAESAPLDPTNLRHLALRLRQRESIRRAATTILRISTYSPRRWLARVPTSDPSPAFRPEGPTTVAGGAASSRQRTSQPPESPLETLPPAGRTNTEQHARSGPVPPPRSGANDAINSRDTFAASHIPLRNAEGVAASSRPGEAPSSLHSHAPSPSHRPSPSASPLRPEGPTTVAGGAARAAGQPPDSPLETLPPEGRTNTEQHARSGPIPRPRSGANDAINSRDTFAASHIPLRNAEGVAASSRPGEAPSPSPAPSRLRALVPAPSSRPLSLLSVAGAPSPLPRHNRAPP